MDAVDILFDRLAGTLMLYVDNYFLSKSIYRKDTKFKIQPSYEVDYEIPEEILEELKKSITKDDMDNIWFHLISGCRDINDLPDYIQKLIIMYLPRFIAQYPQYQDHPCLKINVDTTE